jgi:hypothetical protein
VEITGSIGSTPTMRFISREKFISDHFGEKLNPAHVQRVLDKVTGSISLDPFFMMLAPTRGSDGSTSYTLFLDRSPRSDGEKKRLKGLVEKGLRENFHYEKCRQHGQLADLRLYFVDRSPDSPEEIFTREMARRGVKVGDIKPSVLDRETGWDELLPGQFYNAG